MADIEYILATNLDRAWLNFELDLPLEPMPGGRPNPFYVDRPGNPVAELEDALLAPFYQPPKYFFSGHRGCGKSTELRRLAANPAIQKKFWPVNFTIRDEADVNNIDFRDVLLAVGGRMFREYRAQGGKLPEQLLKELDSWRGQIETEIKTIIVGRTSEFEIEAGLDAFFANAGLKMKLEPATRGELRQVFERNITGLIDAINKIAIAIQAQEKRLPLVLIDDLDKDAATVVCHRLHRVERTVLQHRVRGHPRPGDFPAQRKVARPPPIIAKRPRRVSNTAHVRPQADVTRPNCPGCIGRSRGCERGVFRELVRVTRTAIGRARRRKSIVEVADVEWAQAEIRNEYRRILDADDQRLLGAVRQHNQLEQQEGLGRLLQLLAVLEYCNDENWCDVHPVLNKLLDEKADDDASG